MSVDALTSSLAALQDVLDCMPAVRAMQIRLDGYADGVLRITAPLAANVNDKGNAFGGSLVSLMTLAGWGLVNLQLQQRGLNAEVYVADSQVRYLAPLYADLRARAWPAEGESWEAFFATLEQRGRARLRVVAEVPLAEGGVATAMEARFVAIARR